MGANSPTCECMFTHNVHGSELLGVNLSALQQELVELAQFVMLGNPVYCESQIY